MLVGKDQQKRLFHFSIKNDPVKFLSCFVYSRPVVGVNDEDEALSTRKIVPPERSDLVLTTDIPHIELHILVRHRLDVEADRWDRSNILSQFELVENRCTGTSVTFVSEFHRWRILVFPAASRPSMSSRISFDPKTFAIILENWPPIFLCMLPRQA